MKQTLLFLTLVIAFGASGRVFGIDKVPYQSEDEIVQVQLEHFDPADD